MNKYANEAATVLFMGLVYLAVLALALGLFPGQAHAAPAPTEKVSHVNPDGTAVLYIYPPLRDLQETDEIIGRRASWPFDPEAPIPTDPTEAAKDPRTWA